MKRVLVLGSTGSIGVQALEVIDAADDMEACGLSCGANHEAMAAQAAARAIAHTACLDGGGTLAHDADLVGLIERSRPDLVLNAIVGAAGLRPTLAALERGLPVALANKESLVAGGDLVAAARARTGAPLVPIDSEHSALFQLLEGVDRARVRAAVLTASGGPFRERADLSQVRPEDALAHPVWEMGAKITVDSATLMNKGLELIEAHHLFGLAYDQLEIVVHPQSTIHALVRLEDGSLLAHAGPPDMRVPIAHALRHPAAPPPRAPFELVGLELTFEAPDTARFPCLALARRAGVEGGTAPAALNAANEVAVGAFLGGRLPFAGIPEVVETVLDELPVSPADDLETVLEVDARAREIAERRCGVAVGGAA